MTRTIETFVEIDSTKNTQLATVTSDQKKSETLVKRLPGEIYRLDDGTPYFVLHPKKFNQSPKQGQLDIYYVDCEAHKTNKYKCSKIRTTEQTYREIENKFYWKAVFG